MSSVNTLHLPLILIVLLVIVTGLVLANASALTVKLGDEIKRWTINGTHYGNFTYDIDTGEKNATHALVISTFARNATLMGTDSVPAKILDMSNGTFIYKTHLALVGTNYPYTIQFAYGNKTANEQFPICQINCPRPPDLPSSENQTVINMALAVPWLQDWSHGWKFVGMNLVPDNLEVGTSFYKWQSAIVHLQAPSDSASAPCPTWFAHVAIDLTTMKVVQSTYHPTMESHPCIVGGPGEPAQESSKYSDKTGFPLEQIWAGVLPQNVKCSSDFQLILKSENGSPACVSHNTAQILIERGWGHLP